MREIRHKRRENESGVFVKRQYKVFMCVCEYIYPFCAARGCLNRTKKALPFVISSKIEIGPEAFMPPQAFEYIPSFFLPNPMFCLLLCLCSRGHPLCASVQHTSYGMVYYYYYIRNEFFCMNSQRKLVGIIIVDRRTYREWGGWGCWYGDERFPPRLLFLSLCV